VNKLTTVLFAMRSIRDDGKRYSFQQNLLLGAQQQAAQMGWNLEVINTRQDLLALGSVDHVKGVLLESPHLIDEQIIQLQHRLRMVTLHSWSLNDVVGIGIQDDMHRGMRQAIEHLHRHGHTRIGYIGFTQVPQYPDARYSERAGAFLEVCRHMQVPLTEDAVQLLPSDFWLTMDGSDEIGQILRRWKQSPQSPTAVLCYNDLLAARVLLISLSLGIRVPEHLSLIGYDDEPICQTLSPQLTSISPGFFQMGSLAVSSLADDALWKAKTEPCKIIVPSQLIDRQSVAHPFNPS
jgi:DNA-binding LacI/PurR family transcriptional regulator